MSAFVRFAWFVCALLAIIVLIAAAPVYYHRIIQPTTADPYGLGHLSPPFQILVDLGDFIGSFTSFALAVLLFCRKGPNDHIAIFVSFFCLVTAITGIHVLDYALTAYFGTPSTYTLWPSLQNPLWVLLFCTFPDGCFVPHWTRWIFIVSIPLSVTIFAGAEAVIS